MEPANLVILVLFFGVMYLTLIRPQKKRQAEHQQLIKSATVGDEVVTIGGLHGQIVARDDDSVDLQVSADGTILRFESAAIRRRVTDVPAAPAEEPSEVEEPAELEASDEDASA